MNELPMLPGADRVPPRDFDAEQQVLGTILLDGSWGERIWPMLRAEDFYWVDHQHIFECLKGLHDRGDVIDAVTAQGEWVRRGYPADGALGVPYLRALCVSVVLEASVERHARTVREKAILRGLAAELQRAAADCYEPNAEPLPMANRALEAVQRQVEERLRESKGLRTPEQRADRIKAVVARAVSGRRPLSAIRLGIGAIDRQLGPLVDHRIVVVKGRQGTGKTHIAVNAIVSSSTEIIRQRTSEWIIVFSFESPGMYDRRCIAWLSGVDNADIRMGFSGEAMPSQASQVRAAGAAISGPEWPVAIFEDPATEDRIESELRIFGREHVIGLVVIDFWQAMMTRWGRSRVEELDNMAVRFKGVADEFACPFLILSQATFNPVTGEHITKGSRALEEFATLAVRLVRDNANREWLECDKTREGAEFGRVQIRMNKTTSHIYEVSAAEHGGPYSRGETSDHDRF